MKTIYFRNGDDVANLANRDRKEWYAISMPIDGIRFDRRTLELLDTDHDGRIRVNEVIGAIEFLKSRNFDFETLFKKDAADEAVLADKSRTLSEDDERVIRYRLNLLEFLENYVNMNRLYKRDQFAVFQAGTLRIDAKELHLCFPVADEEAHSALVERSMCYLAYLKLTRPSEEATRNICAAVTAGTIARLYVGRNGVFYDCDGKDWEAVVTKIVEAQVSLREAFWSPWKKLGDAIASAVKKFLGDKQNAALAKITTPENNGAAMASGVAAIGIGVGMIGAAAASVLAAISNMSAVEIALAIGVLILLVSMPSVILTWFRLRKRDIAVILNASGWAINRPMRFSMSMARMFTVC